MLTWAAKKLFGTANDRALRRLESRVPRINSLEPKLSKLTDPELQAKTPEFRQRLANGEPLDALLDEAFAVGREAGKRALSMRHYDVQLIGGMVLHRGSIAEMKTGEGKTLVATLPIYLNALEGKGVHLITVNDYLAKRDAEWMGKIYNFLGLSVGTIVNQQSEIEKRRAYQCDICYGQNNEFGFDYLRDNMKLSALDYAQRTLHYAIVDEVDSILIDEARTPLIISGSAEPPSQLYRTLNELVAKLRKDEHYAVDEKAFTATLTDEGVELIQQLMEIDNLYDPTHVQRLHIVYQLLRAHTLYKRDVHYMVSPGGEVLIIDEFTGRVLRGRRWSDGLHQAVEAKENVRIQTESRTMATITFQNLFRLYNKLAGMTGTAQTEAQEFHSTYKLDVVAIPTNRVVARQDDEDVVYKTEREKFTAVIADILEQNAHGRPVLVGTTSVEKSTAISRILTKKKVPHHVLNAKHHENEAYVVAQAGRKGAITVSTNMAGRGTDIILGGNPEMLARLEFREANRLPEAEPEAFGTLVTQYKNTCGLEQAAVVQAGGLHIVGTERHESRRIDNQLRGRAGRQGDPGSSRFYLSLEDDLMRIFGGERVKNLMDRMGMPDDEPIEHPWVTKSVENAQRKVEERNFDTRKNLLEYDDVMNAQRKTVYALRQSLLLGRYAPEEVDEVGKPTGEARAVEVLESVREQVTPIVGQLINMFGKEPVQSIDAQGNPRSPTAKELESLEQLVEVEGLQREIYEGWGVKVELDVLRKESPTRVYEMVLDLASRGLSEQRERTLDLIDRVIAAMMEESCPPNRAPEDWDWKGIHQGFREHFATEIDKDIDQLGDVERLVRLAFERAEAAFFAKEKSFGLHQLMRLFHALYIEEIDRAWVDHLTNMEHLRDGIGLRGYGQRDPKQEYKKEGYDLFLSMVAKVSSNVLAKTFEFKAEGSAMAELEAQTLRHQEQIDHAQARHPEVVPRPMVPETPAVTDEEPCPCGSGKAFRKCHGAALAEDEVQATA